MILMFREPFLSPTDNLPCFMPNSISQHCVILSYPVSRWLPTTIQSSAIQVSFSEWSVLEKRKPGSCNLNQHNLIIEGCFFFKLHHLMAWSPPRSLRLSEIPLTTPTQKQANTVLTQQNRGQLVGRQNAWFLSMIMKSFATKLLPLLVYTILRCIKPVGTEEKYPQIMVDGLIKPHSAKWVGKDFLCIQR